MRVFKTVTDCPLDSQLFLCRDSVFSTYLCESHSVFCNNLVLLYATLQMFDFFSVSFAGSSESFSSASCKRCIISAIYFVRFASNRSIVSLIFESDASMVLLPSWASCAPSVLSFTIYVIPTENVLRMVRITPLCSLIFLTEKRK